MRMILAGIVLVFATAAEAHNAPSPVGSEIHPAKSTVDI